MSEFVIGRCSPLQGGSYIGLHREDSQVSDKKRAKTAEVDGLTARIDVAETGVKEATAALRDLADAANVAREALDRLCNRGVSVQTTEPRQIKIAGLSPEEYLHVGVRPAGTRFKL